MELTDDELRLAMLLIESAALSEPEQSAAWKLLAGIQDYRNKTHKEHAMIGKDYELIAQAAKAVDMYFYRQRPNRYHDDMPVTQAKLNFPVGWNPLVNDGDAFRLALDVELTIAVSVYDVEIRHFIFSKPIVEQFHFHGENNRYTATRKAIVRAAASLVMPSHV